MRDAHALCAAAAVYRTCVDLLVRHASTTPLAVLICGGIEAVGTARHRVYSRIVLILLVLINEVPYH